MQGHGRTADIDRPLSFEAMANDIAALMKHLGMKEADVMGYSPGGGVPLQTAFRHPGSVRKLVVSEPCKRAGWYPEVLAAMSQMGPSAAEQMKQSPLRPRSRRSWTRPAEDQMREIDPPTDERPVPIY